MSNKIRIGGSSLDSLFAELGELEEMNARLSKRIFIDQLRAAMKRHGITMSTFARRVGNKASAYRILDADVRGLTLDSMTRAAAAVGMGFQPLLTEKRKMEIYERKYGKPVASPKRDVYARKYGKAS